MKNKLELLALFFIFFLSIFLRFNNIVAIPNGFNQDESAIGYNAYSILETGKDEHGKSFPLYFKSFGDQKLPVYIYLTAISEKLFGVNEFAVRFPSALLGSLTVLAFYFILKILAKNKKVALVAALFLAINPWHLFFSRAAFEVNAALSFSAFGILFFFLAIKSSKWMVFFLSILSFALSLYSYNVSRLLAPVLLSGLIVMNLKTIRQIPKKWIFTLGSFCLILLSPFIITFFSPAGAASASGALITSTDIEAKSLELRSYVAEPAPIIGKLFFNKYVSLAWQYVGNIVGTFSVNFFFIQGSYHGSQGIGNMGTFYLLEFIFIVIGIVLVIKDRIKNFYFFFFWAILSILTLSLSKEVPHATRGYFLVIPLVLFSAVGFLFILQRVSQLKNLIWRNILYIGIFSLCLYNVVYYFTSYYYRFPILYAEGWRQQDKYLSKFIKLNDKNYDKVIFDTNAGFVYTSLLFFNTYSPEDFQKSVTRLPDDSEGFSYVKSFGKYEWKQIDWSKDIKQPRTLLITSADKLPIDLTPTATFSYPQRPVVLSTKETIAQYPVQKSAYVLVETE